MQPPPSPLPQRAQLHSARPAKCFTIAKEPLAFTLQTSTQFSSNDTDAYHFVEYVLCAFHLLLQDAISVKEDILQPAGLIPVLPIGRIELCSKEHIFPLRWSIFYLLATILSHTHAICVVLVIFGIEILHVKALVNFKRRKQLFATSHTEI